MRDPAQRPAPVTGDRAPPAALDALETRAAARREAALPDGLTNPADFADEPPARWDCPFCGHELHGTLERCPACGAPAVPPDAVAIDVLRGNARAVYVLQALTPLCGVSAV